MSKTLESKFNSAIRQRKELEAVFSSLIESIIVTDENFIIKDINQAALNLFKITNNSISEISLIQLTHNSELNGIAEKTLTAKRSQYKTIMLKEQILGSTDKFENQKFTSRDLYLEVNTSLIQTEDQSTRIILVLHDITQLKTLERIRKDFVANVSHELKTPVTSIMGFIETLQNGAINNKKDSLEFLNIIQSQSISLDLIIKDLLSLSSLESSENTEIELEELNLSEIVSSAIEVCHKDIGKKKTEIQLSFPDSLTVRVNPILMEQAIINLISNAVRYSPEKSRITIYGESFQDYNLIKITDNGPGIPEKDIPRVFERFYTVNKARSRELGGTGLGLAIVKHIVLAHKGEININSKDGMGTEFIIRIPS
jgi:two-component system phosphate regulon sensor histidine kinase PhoR